MNDMPYRSLLDFDFQSLVPIGIPALVVVVGWFLGHWLNSRRDLAQKKREARIKALEAAYLRLATTSNRPATPLINEQIEAFVSEIQLYGTPAQVQLTRTLVEDFVHQRSPVPYDAILVSLRDSIRKELSLEPLKGGVMWLRLAPPSPPSPPRRLVAKRNSSNTA